MQVKIETTDPNVLSALAPLVKVAEGYDGHFNYSYTKGGYKGYQTVDWAFEDNRHKRTLQTKLQALPESRQFVIGTGGGHMWVAVPTVCDIATKELRATDIHDRVLLITDKA